MTSPQFKPHEFPGMRGRRRREAADLLRERIEHGLERRVFRAGDKVPGTREIALELHVDPRVVSAAYRQLAAEGLVEIRPRSGVYVSRNSARDEDSPPPARLLAETLAVGIDNGYSIASFSEFIDDAARGGVVRAAVVAGTADQAQGICRELRTDYGLVCAPVLAENLTRKAPVPDAILKASLLVTTHYFGEQVTALAKRHEKPVVVMGMRPGIISEDWKRVMQNELVIIAADPRFFVLLREYLGGEGSTRNVRMLIAGRDDVSGISRSTPTYVTEAARQILGKIRIPGRVIQPPRLIGPDCARDILNIVVELRLASRH